MKMFDNGVDIIVASDQLLAERCWEKYTGDSAKDYNFEWTELEPDTMTCAWMDPDDISFPVPESYLKEVGSWFNLYCATVQEWLEVMGKFGFEGFWTSREY